MRVTPAEDQTITIIYPPVVDWYMLYQRPQQLVTAFSKIPGIRCIFVSNEGFRRLPQSIVKMKDSLFVVKPGIDYRHLIIGKRVLWFSYPPHYQYARNNKYDLVVFDAIDLPVDELAFWSDDEAKAVYYADIISCTAELIYDSHKNSGKPVFMCPNAADYEHFSRAQQRLALPGDLPRFSKDDKVVGFYGAAASWVDFKLIKKIADRYTVVLVGKNSYYSHDIEHRNVISLEHRDYHMLPRYLSYFNVAMIPFKMIDLIEGCDPIKFYEFIAAGKPVVATEVRELKNRFSDITYFMNYDNCHEVIAKALAEDSPAKQAERMEAARRNTWDDRAHTALAMIRRHL